MVIRTAWAPADPPRRAEGTRPGLAESADDWSTPRAVDELTALVLALGERRRRTVPEPYTRRRPA